MQQPNLDVVTFNIVSNALLKIAEEMGVNLIQVARSTIIREARDASCALLTAQGDIVAQAQHIPIHMCSLSVPLKNCLAKHKGEISLQEAFLTNDPYDGGQHLQDLIVFSPVFHDGSLIAFTGSIAHHVDIGGGSAGMTYDAREFYQEGIRFPALKIDVEKDLGRGGIIEDLIRGNFRQAFKGVGDLKAQLSANRIGAVRLTKLIEKYGIDVIKLCLSEIINYSERLTRQAISKIPNGTYYGEDMIDERVFSSDPARIKVAVTIEGSDIIVDFEGTDPQVDEFINVPFGSTLSTTYSCIKMIVDRDSQIPANEGSSRPIKVIAPLGTLVNPRMPAAVRARMCGAYRIFDSLLQAFYQAMPGQIPAQGFHVNTTVGFSHFSASGHSIFIEDIGGGWGATPTHDGADMLDTPLSNCKITPVEAVEMDHPFIMVERFELLPDSGGAGKFRGGLGATREFRVLEDNVEFFGYADRHHIKPQGVMGGMPGTTGEFSVLHEGEWKRVRSKIKVKVSKGDLIRVIVGGGGGFGDSTKRSAELIEKDLLEKRITPEHACYSKKR